MVSVATDLPSKLQWRLCIVLTIKLGHDLGVNGGPSLVVILLAWARVPPHQICYGVCPTGINPIQTDSSRKDGW